MSNELDAKAEGAGTLVAAVPGQSAAHLLDERERDLTERGQEIRERQRDLEERTRGADEREKDLDARRRQLVQQWANVDERSQTLRDQSSRLDVSRQDLGRRHEDLGNRQQELLERMREFIERSPDLTQEDIREQTLGHAMRRRENDALSAQLSVDIERYNLDYDDFLGGLEEHIGLEEVWRNEMSTWLSDRQQHNLDVNQRNRDGRSLRADLDVLVAQRSQLRREIKAHIGPYVVDEAVRRQLTAKIDQRLWLSNDRMLVGTQFELLCVDVLRAMSFRVTYEGGTDDRGIDIRAEETARSGEAFRYVIQCKYKGKDGTVGRTAIAQLAGDLPSVAEYDKAVFMTAGRFESEAAEHATQRGISTWDGVWLCQQLIDEEIGFKVGSSTAGYDIQFDNDYWDELLARAQAEHEKRKKI